MAHSNHDRVFSAARESDGLKTRLQPHAKGVHAMTATFLSQRYLVNYKTKKTPFS